MCRTYDRLVVNAALDMFSTRPYDEVSVDDIARAAGVPGCECHRRYGSKQGIYLAALRQAVEDASATLSQNGSQDLRERLRYGLRAYLDCMTASPAAYLTLPALAPESVPGDGAEAWYRDELRHVITRILTKCAGIEDRPEPLPSLVPGWVALAESVLRDWARRGVPGRDELETVLCDLFVAFVETAHGSRAQGSQSA